MAEAVAEQVLTQFAGNFAAELQARQLTAADTAPAADAAVAVPPGREPGQEQLNGVAMIWGALISWLRSLFRLRGT
jgi:hypothetical protein